MQSPGCIGVNASLLISVQPRHYNLNWSALTRHRETSMEWCKSLILLDKLLAKVGVEGSNPFARSRQSLGLRST
ncbi:hypothetical protein BOSE62_130843 [Bosea sp. 62]|nr:hypothetical protein BOSE7B_120874 [Bosea sp. 7B]CAD5273278.1 hypothetical protein BOSE21B_30038 [Bosea sp. 21B]CAD5284802.1 hypothetical protein BOSE46_50208 [Bosea sp. 46]VVT60224.1 hypothetical protein BOS5A_211015 [Bosea sp. EC-HK365B]VXB60022.1 hypothetical protein BOSE62_130843 [Bosea sp. 62]VXC10763.1 hypothetical protein BOSE29B_30038 [Bosea sp. 29B]VXC22218.1 hypothetical protein BOSE127_170513 [Bosea sp. 127]VXC63386.1 hypothetical protein BOSE125_30419 [Bosea sp. 125]